MNTYLESIRNKYNNIKYTIEIYYCENYYNNLFGSYYLTDNKFESIKSKLSRLSSPSIEIIKIYSLGNKKLILNNKKKSYIIEHNISSNMFDKFVINIIDRQNIYSEDFPLFEKYHDIQQQHITKYVYNDITIMCIQNNNNNNYIKLECDSKKNTDTLIYILEEIF
jgi:hypothetical protein